MYIFLVFLRGYGFKPTHEHILNSVHSQGFGTTGLWIAKRWQDVHVSVGFYTPAWNGTSNLVKKAFTWGFVFFFWSNSKIYL